MYDLFAYDGRFIFKMRQEELLYQEQDKIQVNSLHWPEMPLHYAECFVEKELICLIRLIQLVDWIDEEPPCEVLRASQRENLTERVRWYSGDIFVA